MAGGTAAIGSRVAARLADIVLVMAPAWLVVVPLVLGVVGPGASAVVAGAVGWAITVGYETHLTRVSGQTIGKRALGIRVVEIATGRPPSFGASLARAGLPPLLGLLTGGIGWIVPYVWAIWAPERRGLHDRLARTRVLQLAEPDPSSGGRVAQV